MGERPPIVGDEDTLPPVMGGTLVGAKLARRYEIVAAIGAGGMGAVYRARDHELDEVVALKVLKPEIATMPGVVERFRREVKLARRVTHPNVARTYELGEDGGLRFLTMEHVEGESLAAMIARRGRLAPDAAASMLAMVADALGAAHAAGVVHRDVKPDNILITPGGRVVVTDFGIAASVERNAKETGGGFVGTPAYVAPEQIGGGNVGPAADLYELGVVAYEALTGALPFHGPTAIAIAAARLLHDAPDPRTREPAIPEALAAVVGRCLQRAPEARFASAGDLARALRAAVGRTSESAPSPLPSVPPPQRTPTHPGASAGHRVAVMPFAIQGVEPWMGEALAEEAADALTGVNGLRVLARSAIARAGGDPRALGASVLVEGSVRPGAALARLVDVETGSQRWTARMPLAPERIAEIAREVAAAVAGELGADEAQAVVDRGAPADPAALELYVRARQLVRELAPGSVAHGVELFREARARAPESALIDAGLARALARLAFTKIDPGEAVIDEARAAAARALARGPQLGEAHVASGALLMHIGDPVGAARAFRAAIARAPSLADAHQQLGHLLIEAADVAAGARRIEVAIGLDPMLAVARWDVARAAALAGDWAQVRTIEQQLLAGRPRSLWLSHVRFAVWKGDREAIAALEAESRSIPRESVFDAAMLDGLFDAYLRGDATRARASVAAVRASAGGSRRRRSFYLQLLAEIEAHLGRDDAALEALRDARDAGLGDLLWLDRCPLFGRLREHPHFAGVREDVAARATAITDALFG